MNKTIDHAIEYPDTIVDDCEVGSPLENGKRARLLIKSSRGLHMMALSADGLPWCHCLTCMVSRMVCLPLDACKGTMQACSAV